MATYVFEIMYLNMCIHYYCATYFKTYPPPRSESAPGDSYMFRSRESKPKPILCHWHRYFYARLQHFLGGKSFNKRICLHLDSKKGVWTGKALSADVTVVVSTIKNIQKLTTTVDNIYTYIYIHRSSPSYSPWTSVTHQ